MWLLKLQSSVEGELHVAVGERRHQTERTKHCSTSDVYGDNDGLRQHCELVTDAYTRSFVIGLYLLPISLSLIINSYILFLPYTSPMDSIWLVTFVWRIAVNIIRTVLVCSYKHTHSYRWAGICFCVFLFVSWLVFCVFLVICVFLFFVVSFAVYNTALDSSGKARLWNDSYVLRGMLNTTHSLRSLSLLPFLH